MKLYLLSIEEAKKLPDGVGEALFPKRMERARRFRKTEDYWRCVGAGILLSRVLGAREEDLSENAYHKPFLKNSNTFFNLSHSGQYVLLAVDDREVGADIEVMDEKHLPLAKEVFWQEEIQWMRENPLSRFFTLWTLKESVMKQQGLGFSLPPQKFSVLPLVEGGPLILGGQELYAYSTEYDGCAISVCTSYPLSSCSPEILDESCFR